MRDKIFVGFEVETGKEVYVKPSHLVVTGLTRSGKTTCIESIIKESGGKAILFKTKIGEKELTTGKQIPPFFKEEHDWIYVQSLLEATLKEKLKFERAWIIDLCKGSHSLQNIKDRLDEALETGRFRGRKISSLTRNIYMTLQAYFELVLPQIQDAKFSNELQLSAGINVMDLEAFSSELQSLVIRSVLEEILFHHIDTYCVLPEMWKVCPERTSNPVKPVAEAFIRQGATNRNFLCGDSQDLAGVSKSILKQVSVYVLGRQSEINEVKHTLAQIPLPTKAKPKPEEIQTLKVGQFYVCTPDFTKKIYSKPIWMDAETAKEIAMGSKDVDSVTKPENSNSNLNINEDKIVNIVLTRLYPIIRSMGVEITRNVLKKVHETKTYELAPLNKIQKDFLEDTKKKILEDISQLTEGQKGILKFIETKGEGTTISEILDRAFGLSMTSENNRRKILEGCNGLKYLNLIRMDDNNRIYPYLKDRIQDRLQFYDANNDEIKLVYNHVMSNLV